MSGQPAPATSASLPSAIEISRAMLENEFTNCLAALPKSMIGPLGGTNTEELKMPMEATDGRVLTWKKMSLEFINKITTAVDSSPPQSKEVCWFFKGQETNTSGYPSKKIAAAGEKNKWPVHRIMFFMKNPQHILKAKDKKLEVSHLCGRGRFDFGKDVKVSCINPYHLFLEAGDLNKSRRACINGCRSLCPHEPHCVWTDLTGARQTCRDRVPVVGCMCGGHCFDRKNLDPVEKVEQVPPFPSPT